MKLCYLFILIWGIAINAKDHDNVFNEELVMKELTNDFIYSYFQFTTRWNIKTRNDRKKRQNTKKADGKIIIISFLFSSSSHRFTVAILI